MRKVTKGDLPSPSDIEVMPRTMGGVKCEDMSKHGQNYCRPKNITGVNEYLQQFKQNCLDEFSNGS